MVLVGVLTGNKITDQPLEVISADPVKEREQTGQVPDHILAAGGELAEVLHRCRVLVEVHLC